MGKMLILSVRMKRVSEQGCLLVLSEVSSIPSYEFFLHKNLENYTIMKGKIILLSKAYILVINNHVNIKK